MPKTTTYQIIRAGGLDRLQTEINHWLSHGWRLVGGPFTTRSGYAQAIRR